MYRSHVAASWRQISAGDPGRLPSVSARSGMWPRSTMTLSAVSRSRGKSSCVPLIKMLRRSVATSIPNRPDDSGPRDEGPPTHRGRDGKNLAISTLYASGILIQHIIVDVVIPRLSPRTARRIRRHQSKKALGSLQRVDLRNFWEDEAREFTPWLAQEPNLRLLGEAIEIELEFE